MTNRKAGDAFEREFAQYLHNEGFWVHRLAQNAQGQPFDIIAVRLGIATAVDCKDCENDVFPLSRIEQNQASAMKMWDDCGNGTGWFALRFTDNQVFMLSFTVLRSLHNRHGFKTINRETAETHGYPLKRWVRMCT